MVLTDFLYPGETIVFQSNKIESFNDHFFFYITDQRILLYRRRGVFVQKGQSHRGENREHSNNAILRNRDITKEGHFAHRNVKQKDGSYSGESGGYKSHMARNAEIHQKRPTDLAETEQPYSLD